VPPPPFPSPQTQIFCHGCAPRRDLSHVTRREGDLIIMGIHPQGGAVDSSSFRRVCSCCAEELRLLPPEEGRKRVGADGVSRERRGRSPTSYSRNASPQRQTPTTLGRDLPSSELLSSASAQLFSPPALEAGTPGGSVCRKKQMLFHSLTMRFVSGVYVKRDGN